jgi:hypothetical protein
VTLGVAAADASSGPLLLDAMPLPGLSTASSGSVGALFGSYKRGAAAGFSFVSSFSGCLLSTGFSIIIM